MFDGIRRQGGCVSSSVGLTKGAGTMRSLPTGHRLTVVVMLLVLAWLPLAAQASEEAQHEVRATIEAQIDAFRRDDADVAYSYAAPSIKSMFPDPNAFLEMVKRGYRPVYRPQSYTFGRFAERDGTYFQQVALVGPDGLAYVALYTLERAGEGLVITGCVLRRVPERTL